jgi:exopolysaccharide biosynthesis polyprenyl glycosylphosphotransferase
VTVLKVERRFSVRPGAAVEALPWLRRYAETLVLLDLAVILVTGVAAVAIRFGESADQVRGFSYYVIVPGLAFVWSTVLALGRCYETRFLGAGTEEFKRVGNACLRLAATVVFVSYAFALDVSRGFVAVALPLGTLGLLLVRGAARRTLYRGRQRGEYMHRVLVVGSHPHVRELTVRLRTEPRAGLTVVGACVPGARETRLPPGPGDDIPVVGALADIPAAIRATGADTVAVAASPGINGIVLRSLSYELEGTGVDLLVAPALTNVTGTRISIRPVAGVPLLHVEEPELTGGRRVLKGTFDRTLAALALLLLAPVLFGLATAVRLSSPGPAIFTQERIGRHNTTFRLWKFRSMYLDAEERRRELLERNEHDGPLFKIRDDPRITPLGRFLRKYSLDELPQLWNVLQGDMSLVGPRPPLASEVAVYERHTHRRLLVKPGITGLWQVSGRADLSWEEAVRLDLRYVEDWSLGLDIVILARTMTAVLRGSGAY